MYSAVAHICTMRQSYLLSDMISYIYSAACCMVKNCSDFICGICVYIHLHCRPIKYLAYMAPGFVGIFVSVPCLAVMLCIYCSGLHFGTCEQKSLVYIHIGHVGSVTDICNVVAILSVIYAKYMYSDTERRDVILKTKQ